MVVLRLAVEGVDQVAVTGDVHRVVALDVFQTREQGAVVDLQRRDAGVGPAQRVGHGPTKDVAGVPEVPERRLGAGLVDEELRTWSWRDIVGQVDAGELVVASARERFGRLVGPGRMQVQRDERDDRDTHRQCELARGAGQPREGGGREDGGCEIQHDERALWRAGVDALEAGEQREQGV
ncbi:MAG TPA: hypothetical protein VGK33_22825 [Chloroflexota bacterium]